MCYVTLTPVFRHGRLQVVDDTEGPMTKRDYEQAMVPGREGAVGRRPGPAQPPAARPRRCCYYTCRGPDIWLKLWH